MTSLVRPWYQQFLALVLLALPGCGGAEGERPESTLVQAPLDEGPRFAFPCSSYDALELLPIEDFESGAASNAYTNNELCERCGTVPETDCLELCETSQLPSPYEKPLYAEPLASPQCGQERGLHLKAGPFFSWGGTLGFPFAPAFDAREWEGVALVGRIRSGTRSTFRLTVIDPKTDGTFVDPDTSSASCNALTTPDDFRDGCDPFGAFFVLDQEWKLVLLPFDEMRQAGFGRSSPFLDRGAVRQLRIGYAQGSWDFYIDQVAFYRSRRGK